MKRIEQQKPVVDSVRDSVLVTNTLSKNFDPEGFSESDAVACLSVVRQKASLCVFAAGYFCDGDQRQM